MISLDVLTNNLLLTYQISYLIWHIFTWIVTQISEVKCFSPFTQTKSSPSPVLSICYWQFYTFYYPNQKMWFSLSFIFYFWLMTLFRQFCILKIPQIYFLLRILCDAQHFSPRSPTSSSNWLLFHSQPVHTVPRLIFLKSKFAFLLKFI